MNLLLIHPADFIQGEEHLVRITGRRCEHICTVLKGEIGLELKAGLINGNCGTGTITAITASHIDLLLTLTTPPPPPLPLTLICALPRPKSFKKSLATATSLGIKKIFFIGSWRVDKSYWQSPLLAPPSIKSRIVEGLEQARDTIEPEVVFKKRFKPFVEDELPGIIGKKDAYVAHPYYASPCPFAIKEETVLVIGPEGGFIPYEIELLKRTGCTAVTIGERILRVETAIAAFAGRFW